MKYLMTLLVLVALFFNKPLSANDYKLISATSCEWSPSAYIVAPATGATVQAPFSIDAQGGLYVSTAQVIPQDPGIYVSCPILRDYTTNTDGLIDVRVNAYDASSTLQLGCSIWSVAADGMSGWGQGGVGTGIAFAGGYVQFTFSGVHQLNHSTSGGAYSIDCVIPGGAGSNLKLLSYYSVEQSGGDTH